MSNPTIEPLVFDAWYIAAWSHELADKPLARTILNEDLVLFRTKDGRAAALEDRCCHRAAPLTHGDIVERGIQCGYHGLVFDGDGVCVDNPGEDIDASQFKVKAFPIVEKQNFVWIWMGNRALADESEIIDFPYHDRPDEWPFQFGRYSVNANYMFMIDNLMDLTHLGYVHKSTIGGFPNSHQEATMETKPTETGVHFLRWMLNAPPPPSFVNAAGFKGNVDRWSDFEYVVPCSVLQWGGALDVGLGAQQNRNQESGLSLRLFHHATPETDTTCHYFWSVASRNTPFESERGKGFYTDVANAFLEDKAIIEAQQAIVSKEPDRPLLFRQHDKAVALGRRALHGLQQKTILSAAE